MIPTAKARGHRFALFTLILILLTSACQSVSPAAPNFESTQTISQSEANTAAVTEEPAELNTETADTATKEPTEAQPTPTPAPTLEDWREAPITPEISDRVVEIYQEGQRQGRDPASFSVIGDCQSIPFVFMGPFGRGELEPDASENYLWDALNYFRQSFRRWSITSRGGFTAASILSAPQADSEECKPGETPLTCEFRLNNPAFVFITLETWLNPDTVDRYEIYLRQILDTVIEKGAVPILLTKADSSELRGERHVINPVIVNLAYEYQVPVINFYQAAQYLDNHGIDPDREGFHLSSEGYKLKNVLALRALYAVWTKVAAEEAGEVQADIQPTASATERADNAFKPEISSPDCSEGCVFFGTMQSLDGSLTAQGVFAYQLTNASLTQVLPQGYDLQDVSNDSLRLLVNAGSNLMEVNLETGEITPISESFNDQGRLGSYWSDEEDNLIYLDTQSPIETENGTAFSLILSPGSDSIYFEGGSCISKDYCQSDGIFVLEPDGIVAPMSGYGQPTFSSDGKWLAYVNPDAAKPINFYHISYMFVENAEIGISSRRSLYFQEEPGFEIYPEVESYAFSPDSNRLFILYDVYSEYYERSHHLQTYMWDSVSGAIYDFGKLDGSSGSLNPRFAWSPDGNQILLFLTDLLDDGTYQINIYRTDLETGEKLELIQNGLFSETDYFYLTNVYWR